MSVKFLTRNFDHTKLYKFNEEKSENKRIVMRAWSGTSFSFEISIIFAHLASIIWSW